MDKHLRCPSLHLLPGGVGRERVNELEHCSMARQLCQKHWGTRFVKINAEKAPYLAEQLA